MSYFWCSQLQRSLPNQYYGLISLKGTRSKFNSILKVPEILADTFMTISSLQMPDTYFIPWKICRAPNNRFPEAGRPISHSLESFFIYPKGEQHPGPHIHYFQASATASYTLNDGELNQRKRQWFEYSYTLSRLELRILEYSPIVNSKL